MTVNPTLLMLQVSSYECNQGPQLTCAKENQDGVSGPAMSAYIKNWLFQFVIRFQNWTLADLGTIQSWNFKKLAMTKKLNLEKYLLKLTRLRRSSFYK